MLKLEQHEVIKEFGVKPEIDPVKEIENRVNFLADYLKSSHCHVYVLGISGGVDSTTAGRLAALACQKLTANGYKAEFVAVRLPYGIQRDESDAQMALDFIQPNDILTVNIKFATDAMINESYFGEDDPDKIDFVTGNIKARQRMVAQYAIAGTCNGLVIGTDHAAEALMGFFTKHGDGACDITPLSGLNKRQVRMLAKELGAPDALINKTPTADLEDMNPGKPDEEAYGVSYNEIDDYLEGKAIDAISEKIILKHYKGTIHKRNLPVTFM